jgi:hypothetical protein
LMLLDATGAFELPLLRHQLKSQRDEDRAGDDYREQEKERATFPEPWAGRRVHGAKCMRGEGQLCHGIVRSTSGGREWGNDLARGSRRTLPSCRGRAYAGLNDSPPTHRRRRPMAPAVARPEPEQRPPVQRQLHRIGVLQSASHPDTCGDPAVDGHERGVAWNL